MAAYQGSWATIFARLDLEQRLEDVVLADDLGALNSQQHALDTADAFRAEHLEAAE